MFDFAGHHRAEDEVRDVEVRIRNRREDMALAAQTLSRFATENGLPAAILHDLNVVIDEALSNIIAYGYDKDVTSEIKLRLEYRNGEVAMVIEDRGRRFDPTKFPAPDQSGPLTTRKVGGVGIHFMRSLMDDISYTRAAGLNRLRLAKKIAR
jgi:anti-sigma regulatory factor (Ser/Thr protein kinase)